MNATLTPLRTPHLRSLPLLWQILFAICCLASGCAVNPVPTPGSASGVQNGDPQSADAKPASDTGASAGAADTDSALDSAADATAASDADTSAATDSDATGELPGDGGGSVECCPMDPPGCNCVSIGGSKGPQGCLKVCDAAPVGWKELIDANGCPYWQTGPQSCMVAPVKCDTNPPSFPSYTKSCQSDADCAFVVHQTDCCGNATAIGVWKEVKGALASAESQCRDQYPACDCASTQPKGEDGKVSAPGNFGVACKNAQCMTFVAD